MITPSFSLTATERVLPRLAIDFTTAVLDSRITFTRSGNTATVVNSSGVIVGVNADIPRFDYNPTTLLCNGLLIEESRTNVLLNSLLNGTSLATQTVVVTAAARTLSFYGTGQIVLSGAASATVTGTGAYPTRTTLTFTPSAGALILTVTGTVQFAQLELGSFATSFIPTTASQVTRTADVATMTGTNFSSWFNATQGTFSLRAAGTLTSSTNTPIISINDGTTNNRMIFGSGSPASSARSRIITSGSTQLDSSVGTFTGNSNFAMSYSASRMAFGVNGAIGTPATGVTVPTVTQLQFCPTNGIATYLKNLNYYIICVTNAEVQAFSK